MPRLKLLANHVVVVPVDQPASGGKGHGSKGHEGCCGSAQRGVVLCAGPGKNPAYTGAFKPGDVVWYDQDVGHAAHLGKNEVVVVDDEDIFALESDLEGEHQIKATVREILLKANVTADGCFECCDPHWEEGAKEAEKAELERNPPPPEPEPEVEPGTELEEVEGEVKTKRSHHKK